jgi:membrane protease YdiL (CAAX protease family)
MDVEPPWRNGVILAGVLLEGGLAVVACGLGWLVGQSPFESLHATPKDAALGVLATLPLLLVFGWSLRSSLRSMARIRDVFEEVVRPALGHRTLVELALLALAAGIGEELLCRGVIQAVLIRYLGFWSGLATASLVFGLLHPITPAYVALAGLMGAYLGLTWVVSDNLLVPIVAHALYDFLALAYLLRKSDRDGSSMPSSVELGEGTADPTTSAHGSRP